MIYGNRIPELERDGDPNSPMTCADIRYPIRFAIRSGSDSVSVSYPPYPYPIVLTQVQTLRNVGKGSVRRRLELAWT